MSCVADKKRVSSLGSSSIPTSKKLRSNATGSFTRDSKKVSESSGRAPGKFIESLSPNSGAKSMSDRDTNSTLDSDKGSLIRGKRGAALKALINITGQSKGKQREVRAVKEFPDKNLPNQGSQDNTIDPTLIDPGLFVSQVEQTCFICNKKLSGDSDYVNIHIDQCLEQGSHQSDYGMPDMYSQCENANNAEFDEYTWMGETRVRAVSLLEGGLKGAGFSQIKKDVDVDEDLNVDEDDEQVYGLPQYTEREIIRLNEKETDERDTALRVMVAVGGSRQRKSTRFNKPPEAQPTDVDLDFDAAATAPELPYDPKLVIDSLKMRVRQLETATRGMSRCLICLEAYDTPVTSIVCWHVHCERCWLQSLGAKKLCPQCQKITSASDLRRVYL